MKPESAWPRQWYIPDAELVKLPQASDGEDRLVEIPCDGGVSLVSLHHHWESHAAWYGEEVAWRKA